MYFWANLQLSGFTTKKLLNIEVNIFCQILTLRI